MVEQRRAPRRLIRSWKHILQLDMVVVLPVVLILQAFLIVLGMQAITFADYNVLYKWFEKSNVLYPIYNTLFIYTVLQMFVCLFKKVTPGYIVTTLIMIAISVINNMKWVNLKECVTISDFDKISEALQVAGEAEFKMFASIRVCVLVGVVLLVMSIVLDIFLFRSIKKQKKKMKICRMTLMIVLLPLILVMVTDANSSAMAKLTESRTADKTGPIVYFVESVFTASLDEPYTLEKAQESYTEYVEQGKLLVEENTTNLNAFEDENATATVKPNIIVIMSEAFYDVNLFEDVLIYSEDPMAYYKEVEEESIVSGNTMVNIYGGSTHFSEFEFLTGWNSKGMNSGSCPYKEYFNEKQPSFARYLDEQGYYTLAVHPYDSFFWNRKRAYPNMGFDRFIDRSGMKYTDKCGYISDDALTNEIIYCYEERQKNKEEPFFCFGVSIANHVAMINWEEFENTANHIDFAHSQELQYSDKKMQRLQDYIGGISKTGEALQKLTDYFEKQEEPTVIVFFGDHAPNYAVDILGITNKEELAYQTPYLIWSNYELESRDGAENINVSYLSTYLIQLLEMPLTEQNYYNIALREEYLYETRYAICDLKGATYDTFSKEEQELYFDHALDIKKHIPALLENSEEIEDIWSIP